MSFSKFQVPLFTGNVIFPSLSGTSIDLGTRFKISLGVILLFNGRLRVSNIVLTCSNSSFDWKCRRSALKDLNVTFNQLTSVFGFLFEDIILSMPFFHVSKSS